MKPIDFEQVNKILQKPASMTDAECSSLRVFTDGQQCISCWQLSWKERLSAVLFGKVWLSVVSSSGTQPPVAITCEKKRYSDDRWIIPSTNL